MEEALSSHPTSPPPGDPPHDHDSSPTTQTTTTTTTAATTAAAAVEGDAGEGGLMMMTYSTRSAGAGGGEGWVNIGEQTWAALRHEWKYKSPNKKDDRPREKKRIDPDVIYTDVTSRGQLSQPVPLSDLVNVLTWVWETDSNW